MCLFFFDSLILLLQYKRKEWRDRVPPTFLRPDEARNPLVGLFFFKLPSRIGKAMGMQEDSHTDIESRVSSSKDSEVGGEAP